MKRFRLLTLFMAMIAASVATAATHDSGVLEKGQSVTFEIDDLQDVVDLTINFTIKSSEADYGRPSTLFEIITPLDTLSFSIGTDAFGSFEPSVILDVSNHTTTARFSEKDDFIKEGCETTVRFTGNRVSGMRVFINGHAADIPSVKIDREITVRACRRFHYNYIKMDETAGTVTGNRLYTIDEIIDRLPDSAKSPAGLYTWLDRENDPQRARPGGFYKLAVIPNDDNGYDIVYLDGATVNSWAWSTGMLKGKLKKTVFVNHYDLEWIDSNHRAVEAETSCTFSDNSIMQLDFPLYSTRFRFSRLNGSAATLIQNR